MELVVNTQEALTVTIVINIAAIITGLIWSDTRSGFSCGLLLSS